DRLLVGAALALHTSALVWVLAAAESAREALPNFRQGDPVLRPLGAGHRRFRRRQVELQHLAEGRRGRVVGPEERMLLAVGLDQPDLLLVAARHLQVLERL